MKLPIVFSSLLISCLLTTAILADTIEVFLTHQSNIKGIAKAKQNGHSLQYYYLDGVTQLEEKLAQKATQQYQQQIDALIKKEGIEKLSKMSNSQRAILFQQYLQSIGIRLPSFSQLLSPQDQVKMQQALANLRYAQDQGVDTEQLPVIIFHGQRYSNNNNVGEL